ncbi:hypothetical protein TWF281_005135 [Arthrobotrys megalospora]
MSEYQKTNPTHGTKTTTSASYSDPKREYSGAVTKDSLAAESLRSGGSFSKGNPTGIMDVAGDKSTLNRGDDTIGVRRVHESEDGGGHVGVARIDDNEEYETPGGEKKFMNPHYGQNWDGEDIESGPQRSKGAWKKAAKDEEFGGVNVVDKQPEIGSEEDPGRYAEKKFLERNAMQAGVPGGGTGEGRGGNPYGVLADKDM